MPAYPFRRWETIEGLARELEPHGVELRQDALTCTGPQAGRRILVLERVVEGTTRRYVVPQALEGKRLTPDLVRSVCHALGLDPRELEGFELG